METQFEDLMKKVTDEVVPFLAMAAPEACANMDFFSEFACWCPPNLSQPAPLYVTLKPTHIMINLIWIKYCLRTDPLQA